MKLPRRGRKGHSHDQEDPSKVAIVLKMDGGHMIEPEQLAKSFEYGHYKAIETNGESWRNGPESFPLAQEDWRTRPIIVGRPRPSRPGDDLIWESFKDQLLELTGKQPRSIYGSLLFK